jgi:hypothetical protein
MFPSGFGSGTKSGASGQVASIMIEYFVSFVVSMDPNDGKGRSSKAQDIHNPKSLNQGCT